MRPRNARPQLVTIRPGIDRSSDANAFGDAPIIASDNRLGSFQVQATISWGRNQFGTGLLGRTRNRGAVAILWIKDLVNVGQPNHEPGNNDVWELQGDRKLFVTDVIPTGPKPIRLGQPSGGWQGWRIQLSDSSPEQRAATSYD